MDNDVLTKSLQLFQESQNVLHDRLIKLGFDISKDEVYSSLAAAKDLIRQRQLRPLLMLEPEALEDFEEFDTSDPNSVVIGLAPTQFNYDALTEAFRLIKNQGAPLIAIHKARYFATKGGLSLGPGCFVTGLEYSADVKAEVVGKPEEKFFNSALHKLNTWCNTSLTPQEAVMIGDDVRDDVLGAQRAGFRGCLVQTGKYSAGDEDKFETKPNYVYKSFADAISELLNNY